VIKNTAFQKYSKMDQSLFTRFVRLGVPYIELNAQGRARPQIATLYNWRYRALGDMVLSVSVSVSVSVVVSLPVCVCVCVCVRVCRRVWRKG